MLIQDTLQEVKGVATGSPGAGGYLCILTGAEAKRGGEAKRAGSFWGFREREKDDKRW